MSNHSAIITHELARLDSRAQSAKALVAQARNLRDAVRAGEISVPSLIRSLANTQPQLQGLRSAVEMRLQTLVKQQLDEARALPPQEQLTRLVQLERSDWAVLR